MIIDSEIFVFSVIFFCWCVVIRVRILLKEKVTECNALEIEIDLTRIYANKSEKKIFEENRAFKITLERKVNEYHGIPIQIEESIFADLTSHRQTHLKRFLGVS